MHISDMIVASCGISDVGLVRQNNEDVWAELPEYRCYILADGMGGHQAGEIAAREAVSTLAAVLYRAFKKKSYSFSEAHELLRSAIKHANAHVFKLGISEPKLRGMGTTLCVLHVHDEGVIWAHVGDSRIYRYRQHKIKLLTKDHSLLSELIDLGQISEGQSEDFHYKNIITRAIGTEPRVEASLQSEPLSSGDIYILCTDGVSDLVHPHEMEKLLKEAKTLSEASLNFVSLCKSKGGHDNISLILIKT